MDANGVMIRRCVPLPGPDETLAMYDSTGVSYPLADSRGTPMAKSPGKRALANGQVAVQGYGAFGEEGGSNIGRFGFTGQMRLPEIGLHYYKARFYDPQIGRFMTPDPAGMVDGPNLYAYVLNDPINFTDPSGLDRDDCVVVTGSRIPRCGSQFTPSIQDGGNTGGGGGGGGIGGGGGGGGFGGGGDPCAGGPADEICIPGGRAPRFPFDAGPTLIIGEPGGRGINFDPDAIRPQPDSGAIEDVSLEVLSLVPGAAALKAASLIRRLTLLAKAGRATDRNGLTKAGRGLQKHSSRQNSSFRMQGTRAGEMSAEGQKALDSILFNPGSTVTRFGNGSTEVVAPDGRGVAFNPNGSFRGFLEPRR